jgi:CRP/FNR family transcriptional regulator, cyclic AMP receptor protein
MSAELTMLAEVPVFQLLDDQERGALCQFLEPEHFAKGETIFSYGDAGDTIYMVRSGRVEVFVENNAGQKIVLAENERGDVFGEISLLDGGPRTAYAVALEETEALTLDRERLLEFISRHPHAALDLLTVMGRRLRNTDELLRSQVSRNVNEEAEERLTFGERIADRVATFGGSWTFICIFGFVLAAWVVLNSVALRRRSFDPYPYILLNLFLSMLAALQAPVIMMSQNRQSAKDRLKADADFEVNMKAELEIAQLHIKVDRIYESVQANFAKIDRRDRSEWGRMT